MFESPCSAYTATTVATRGTEPHERATAPAYSTLHGRTEQLPKVRATIHCNRQCNRAIDIERRTSGPCGGPSSAWVGLDKSQALKLAVICPLCTRLANVHIERIHNR